MNMKRFSPILFLVLGFLLLSFSKNNTKNDDNDKFIVVLDAGHGGHDPGNLGNGYLEKNIALKIVLQVGKILEKNPDIKVIYTRKDDTFIDLYVRGEIANKANADLFVSVHCDSHTSNAHGAGTFVLGLHANKQNFEIAKKENSVIYLEDNYESRYAKYDIDSPESLIGLTIMQEEFLNQSIELAKMMQDNFSVKLKRNDRKVKQAGFIVLHQTFMPSILVETGFLTNKNEGAYLNSKKGQLEMGTAIANAILEYRKGILDNDLPTPRVEDTAPDIVEAVEEEEKRISEEIESKPQIEEISTPKETVVKEEKKAQQENKEGSNSSKETKTIAPPKSKPNILFKVQILASAKAIPLKAENFKGLNKLSKEPYKNLFRYMYGSTDSYNQAKLFKSNADVKGYTSSYIVAYKDGERIAIKEALKYLSD
ncbi:N-acetylmuramoyl-L-alanine amidase family protein [Spongiimicrobium salis]|uniref:N-acetylmuramoyl-L-alanine amidase family protein n=1 Tax=Spongiimicrobium salis TaxID=1667022 RepID=UPI00374D6F2C